MQNFLRLMLLYQLLNNLYIFAIICHIVNAFILINQYFTCGAWHVNNYQGLFPANFTLILFLIFILFFKLIKIDLSQLLSAYFIFFDDTFSISILSLFILRFLADFFESRGVRFHLSCSQNLLLLTLLLELAWQFQIQ